MEHALPGNMTARIPRDAVAQVRFACAPRIVRALEGKAAGLALSRKRVRPPGVEMKLRRIPVRAVQKSSQRHLEPTAPALRSDPSRASALATTA